MGLPETATFAEFARLADVKPGYVTALRKNDRLVLTDDRKRVRVAESLQRIADTKDPTKIGVARRHAAARAAAAAAELGEQPVVDDGAVEPADPNQDVAGTQAIRRDVESEKLRQLRRDNDLAEGKLLDAGEVAGTIRAAVTTLRTRLEALPDMLAPQLAVISDEAKIRALIASSVEHALDELARQFGAVTKEPA